jgi:hypothetical protein
MEQERKKLPVKTTIGELRYDRISELLYEYGTKWTVKVIILSSCQGVKDDKVHCVAGAGMAPPETVSGPLRFRRILGILEGGSSKEKQEVLSELGQSFIPNSFDIEKCSQNLKSVILSY